MSESTMSINDPDRELNIDRLRGAVLWVEQEALKPAPERDWDQSWWSGLKMDAERENYCGTTFCVAGKICLDAGLVIIPNADLTSLAPYLDLAKVMGVTGLYDPVTTVACDWQIAARALLGIDDDESNDLFDATNDAAAVRHVATRIAAAHGYVL